MIYLNCHVLELANGSSPGWVVIGGGHGDAPGDVVLEVVEQLLGDARPLSVLGPGPGGGHHDGGQVVEEPLGGLGTELPPLGRLGGAAQRLLVQLERLPERLREVGHVGPGKLPHQVVVQRRPVRRAQDHGNVGRVLRRYHHHRRVLAHGRLTVKCVEESKSKQ